ncbi:sugar lactone lactonase YvrE [Tamaricihabitans halophyticus]|uniref:Sugar lactone lactonase YvrE n=1 Tax=Tamaricihabitans halophyticus TaxID=1262583 RepID=A0A4R2PZN6_9PSEU|nr:SMP-30/gluconolactonase/LRE family protein [Tamaricihabitans halophyticus]TCP41627.1 sugar lactone lactonase YvrE [Tamaricihabitans halophyticus]
MSHDVRTAIDGMSYLEGPRWHEQRIWFADFYTHRVYSAAEDGGELRVEAEVAAQPSGLGWLPDNRLLIVSMRDARLLRREPDGSLHTHADLSTYVNGHPNDLVVDAQGRAFVGEFGFDLMAGQPLQTAALLRVDPDGTVTTVADDLWFPNGSVITDDGVLLVCETFANRVTAFDIAGDGSLVNRRVWAKFGELPTNKDFEQLLGQVVVAADGCCLDAEGALWIADAVGGRVLRVHEGGQISTEIPVDGGVFACMLGGSDGRTLFLCAAPDFHEQARKNAREGKLLTTRVEVPHGGRP